MLRTSGGRGEYELAGSQGEIRVNDVLDRQIVFSITPEITIPGRCRCVRVDGKPRIRLEAKGQNGEMHAYGFLRGLLLLPEGIRELHATGVEPLKLRNRRFSVSVISVDIVSVTAGTVVLRPKAIEFKNASGSFAVMSIAERLSQVMEIWRVAAAITTPLAAKLQEHQNLVLNAPSEHKRLSAVAAEIQSVLGTEEDCLPLLFGILGLPAPMPLLSGAELPLMQEVDPTPTLLAKRQNLKTWRKVADRGPEASRFRRDVRAAYNSRCAFTGARLPKLPLSLTSGVDAAHILPWSRYDLNGVSNGLCLSKLCHWAFDNGIVRLDFLPLSGAYQLSIPAEVTAAAAEHSFDLAPFQPLVGNLPVERLPASASQRPRPAFLEQMNQELFGT